MSLLHVLVILLAALAAGTINTIVGSGTLITFPVLLALGIAPVTANVSNRIGLAPGTVSGVIGYRRELAGQQSRIWRMALTGLLGGATGALLLLRLSAATFATIVPPLIAVAVLLVLLQPRLTAWVNSHQWEGRRGHSLALLIGTFITSIYGGYFGAGQGVILLGLFGTLIPQGLQASNALKNLTVSLINVVAAIIFMALGHVDWTIALLIAVGSVVGGQLGAKIGRRLSPTALRSVIVLIGALAIIHLLVR